MPINFHAKGDIAMDTTGSQFDDVPQKILSYNLYKSHLPLRANPIIQGTNSARLLIISQAPGTQVHETGLSFNDASGTTP